LNIDRNASGIIDALCQYAAEEPVRMHMPGHKGKPTSLGGVAPDPDMQRVCRILDDCRLLDVTECPGLDNLHYPSGCILRSEEMAQRVFGSLRSYFLINGASCGVQASFLAARMMLGPGEVILPRNTHKSAISAMVMSGFEPMWVRPDYYEDFGGYLPISEDDLSEALKSNRCNSDEDQVKAVFVVNPTYCGFARDLTRIAEIAHSWGAMLIVDEAHGAHFGFNRMLPQSALKCGADIVIHGTHKTTTAFTQTGLLHIASGAQNRFPDIAPSVEESLRSVQSTSPSYLLMSSLEQAIDVLQQDESAWVRQSVDSALELTRRLEEVPFIGISGHNGQTKMPQGIFRDPSRILVDLRDLNITGPEAARYLASEKSIVCEMAGPSYLVMIVTGADGTQEIELVADAFGDLSRRFGKQPSQSGHGSLRGLGEPPRPEKVQGLRESFLSPSQLMEIGNSQGRISADTVVVYPPGSPLIVPGELISSEIIDYVLKARDAGLNLVGRAIQQQGVYCVK